MLSAIQPPALKDQPATGYNKHPHKIQATIPPPGQKFSSTHRPLTISLKRDAAELEQLVMQSARKAVKTPEKLAALVRAFCSLVDCIRVMRGIPSPGQLRPDLDPHQMSKALKRLRERLPTDIAARVVAPKEEPDDSTENESTTSKESLSQDKTPPAPGGPGEE